MKSISSLVFILLLASCTHSPSVPSPEPPPGSPEPADAPTKLPEVCKTLSPIKRSCVWTPAHAAFVEARLTSVILGTDPQSLCPKYASLKEKKKFWSALFEATSKFESGHWRLAKMTEAFVDSETRKLAVSAGLFQLSVGDVRRYKGPACQKLNADTLFSQEINAACAVEIFHALLAPLPPFKKVADTRASLGRYWSTIRDRKVDGALKKGVPECY